jgi:hypothetical protein
MTESPATPPAVFAEWLAMLEARHLADLRFSEVTRALRALSAGYVERRQAGGVKGALDSAGKRAAFGLFYAPLHFLTTYLIVRALDAHNPPPRLIVDLGCGTGAAGGAWAVAAGGAPVSGVDRHPWAVAEARWTYQQLRVPGQARQGDVTTLRQPAAGSAALAAYLLNELPEGARIEVLAQLTDAARRGVAVLIIEPIAQRISPWWPDAVKVFENSGGRADEWRFPVNLPPQLRLLDKAAGLDHRELTARSLYCSVAAG